MGALPFLVAGGIMVVWCLIKGEKLWNPKQFKAAAIYRCAAAVCR